MISMVSIGCGRSNQDSGKKVTINILNYKRETVDILQKMIDKFEKENPNIHIQMDSPSDAMTIFICNFENSFGKRKSTRYSDFRR